MVQLREQTDRASEWIRLLAPDTETREVSMLFQSTLPLRFWSKVYADPSGCWLWTGATSRGYSMFRSRVNGRWSHIKGHRLAYHDLRGVPPAQPRFVFDHLCCIKNCVNPWHLEWVSERENILRGTAPSAMSARSTACKNGHEYTPLTTSYELTARRTQRRVCLTCRREKDRRLRERKKQEGVCL